MLLTRELVQKAVALVEPAILNMMDRKIAKRAALHIAIAYPTRTPQDDITLHYPEHFLYEHSIGNSPEEPWEKPYDEFARAKADLAWRWRMDTAVVVDQYPHLMEEGNCVFPGGVYFQGLAVGASGIQSHFDEMIARWVAAACIAVAKEEMQKITQDPNRAFL